VLNAAPRFRFVKVPKAAFNFLTFEEYARLVERHRGRLDSRRSVTTGPCLVPSRGRGRSHRPARLPSGTLAPWEAG